MPRLLFFLVTVTLIVSIGSTDYFGFLDKLNHQILDSTHNFNHTSVADDIVIVEVDEHSLMNLGGWPWSRERHAKLVEILNKSNVKLIIFDILFTETSSDRHRGDSLFARQISQHQNVVLPVAIQQLSVAGPLIEITPTPTLYEASPLLGHVHIHCDNDGICRSLFLYEGLSNHLWPHVSMVAQNLEAGTLSSVPSTGEINEHRPNTIDRQSHVYLPFPKTPNRYPRVSFSDVIEGHVPSSAFDNKTVFVGVTAAGLGDQIATPSGLIPGVMFHAIALQALQEKRVINKLSPQASIVLFVALSFISAAFLIRLAPFSFLSLSISLIGVAYLWTLVSLKFFQTWTPLTHYMLFILVFYPLWSWIKLQSTLNFLQKRLTVLAAQEDNDFFLDSAKGNGEPNTVNGGFYNADIVGKTLTQLQYISSVIDQQRNFINMALSQLSEAVLLTDEAGNIILFNKITVELLNVKNGASINGLASILHPTNTKRFPTWQSALEEVKQDVPYLSFEVDLTVPSQSEAKSLYCQIQRTDLTSSHTELRHFLLFVFTDITELKRAENARMDTINFLSHDLRSPMVSILAIIENVKAGKNKENNDIIFDKIKNYTEKNLRYAENILLLCKADSIKESSFEKLDISNLIDNVYFDVHEVAHAKDIHLNLTQSDSESTILGDANLLERAIQNIVLNAVKYCPEGTEVKIAVDHLDHWVSVVIQDNGPGIPARRLDSLFAKFKRGEEKHTFGSGLGLFFVKRVIEIHKGVIEVESKEGKGTAFSLKLATV